MPCRKFLDWEGVPFSSTTKVKFRNEQNDAVMPESMKEEIILEGEEI